MREMPAIHYARTPDELHIAYQRFGHGPVDFLWVTEPFSPCDAVWEHPAHLRLWRWLGSFSRTAILDPRGTGASDPVPLGSIGDPADWAIDILAVMDALDFERAVIGIEGYAGAAAISFAVSHPERVQALILMNSYARLAWASDYPMGLPEGSLGLAIDAIDRSWGSGEFIAAAAPLLARDPAFMPILERMERNSASPATAKALMQEYFSVDVRDILPQVSNPTLVVFTGDQVFYSIEMSRYLAEYIPGARMLEIPLGESFYAMDPERGGELETFMTGAAPVGVQHRELATVLFGDIAGSTPRAVQLGDARWRALLDDIDGFVQHVVARHGGRFVKQTGDGHLAIFSSPSAAISAALDIRAGIGDYQVAVRIGLHTGEIEVRRDGDIGGIGVHTAARIMSIAAPHEILASRTVADLAAGSGFDFEDRGEHELKGVPGAWRLSAVSG
jgi:class 3 adenylate cyclase/pimeloyl-ACP methyl ester carboxylesterase